MWKKHHQHWFTRSAVLFLFVSFIVVGFPTFSQSERPLRPTPGAVQGPTQDIVFPTRQPTEVPVTDVPTEVATEVATEVVTVAAPATATPQPTEDNGGAPVEVVETATVVPTATTAKPGKIIKPEDVETFCRMNITNNIDTNPYTFLFTAVGSPNITSYSWNFGDGTTSLVQNPPTKTYTGVGNFAITLLCNISGGGSLALDGVINVAPAVAASFYFPTGDSYDGLPPFTVSAINTSSGVNLTYVWRISASSVPANPGLMPDITTTDINPTLTGPDFVAAGSPATGPAVIWFHLTATDPITGLSATASRSVSFTPPAPLYTFDLTPSEVEEGNSVTFTAVNLGAGPLNPDPNTALVWTFNGGTPSSATGPGPHVVTYAASGVYTATLQYMGPGGGGSASKSVNVYNQLTPVDAGVVLVSTSGPANAIEACFENTSTGNFVRSTWNFIPAPVTPAVVPFDSNDPIVCATFSGPGEILVQLEVADQEYVDNGGVIGQSSNTTLAVELSAAPIADFTFTPNPVVVQGSNVNFTDTSNTTGGGPVTSWLWEVDGVPFSVQSTAQNPTGIPFMSVGDHVIRLTVTGPGGSSYVEKIITVSRLEIGCSITGTPNNGVVVPSNGPQTYTANVTDALGRTLTYAWTLTRASDGTVVTSGTNSTLAIDWSMFGNNYGQYQLNLIVTSGDRSICNTTRTFNREWRELDCRMVATIPSPLYPTGNTLTFTADVRNLGNRTPTQYRWYLNGNPVPVQVGASPTYTYTIPNDSTIVGPLPQSVRYEVDVDNTNGGLYAYVPSVSTCQDTESFNIVSWPDLVCNAASLSGDFTPIPLNDTTGAPRTVSYTVNPSGAAGRTVNYVWSVVNGTITAGQGTATVTVQWDPTVAIENGGVQNGSLSVTATVVNPDGISNGNDTCTSARTIGTNGIQIRYESLVCQAPVGDTFVVIGELADHNTSILHPYGRPISSLLWVLEEETFYGSGIWNIVSNTDTSNPFDSYNFMTPDGSYRLSYSVSVTAANGIAGDSCTSPYLAIRNYGVGVGFECESPSPYLLGNGTPNLPANYVYSTFVDNSTGINLAYQWSLIDRHGTVTPLYGYSSTIDGAVYSTDTGLAGGASLSLAQLGPIGPGTYTLRLEVNDPSGVVTNTCDLQRTLIVGNVDANYSYTINGPGTWTNTALPINRDICLTNTSTHAPAAPAAPSPDAVQYTWTIGGPAANNTLGVNTLTTEGIPCFSFNTPGSYPVTVEIRDADGVLIDTYSQTFNVYGQQSITINRTGSDTSSIQSFTSTGVNITGPYNWVFDRLTPTSNPAFATRTNVQNPTNVGGFTPGTYRATVTGTGPLGLTSASLEFEILAPDGLTARFSPSQWAGVAPMTVCFTDRSISGTPIQTWEWDLDGNGSYETSGVGPHCYTYPNPGMIVQVGLRVYNGTFTRTANNTIRTYTPLEASQNFSIVPQGGMAFCFYPDLVNSTLTGWGYGDGNSAGAVNPACHTYSAAGTYLVEMCFVSQVGNTPGCITRPVTVTGGTPTPPSLTGSGSCSINGTATFNVTNNGGTMSTPDQVRILTALGNVVLISPLQLASGESTSFSISGYYGLLTLETTDVSFTTTTVCAEYTFSAVCSASSLPVFTLTKNPASAPAATQGYTIVNSGGTTVASGNWSLPVNTASVQIPVPPGNDPYDTYTISSAGITSLSHGPCAPRPSLVVTGACRTNALSGEAEVVFTITNNGGAMVLPQNYTVSPGTTPAGSFQLIAGGTTEVVVNSADNPYATYTLTSNSFAGNIAFNHTCTAPTLVVAGACRTNALSGEAEVVFTITNNGGAMLESQNYTVTPGTTPAGSFQLGAGASTEVIVNSADNPYATYTLTSSGFAGNITLNHTCAQPVLSVTSVCTSPLQLTVSNSGGALLETEPFEVRDSTNALITSGTIPTALPFTITLPVGSDPYGTYTLTTDAVVGTVTQPTPCTQPALSVVGVCRTNALSGEAEVVFTITNNSGTMLQPQDYTVTPGTTPDSQFQLVAGGSTEVIVSSADNPYATYTFETTGFAGDAIFDHTCTQPVLEAVGVCGIPRTFTVTNTGGDMLEAQGYTIVRDSVVIVTDTLDLDAGASETVSLPSGSDPYGDYQFVTSGFATDLTVDHECEYPEFSWTNVCGYALVINVTNTGGTPLQSEPWEVTDPDGVVVASGTHDWAVVPMLEITLTGLDPYRVYTFTTTGFTDDYDRDNFVPCESPALEVQYTCAATPSFTISNAGGDMLTPQQMLVSASGMTLIDESIQLAAGASEGYMLDGANPYGTYTLTTSGGFAEELNIPMSCGTPDLTVTGVCGRPAGFVVMNSGSPLVTAHSYRVISSTGDVVFSGSFMLDTGESQAIVLPDGVDASKGVTFISDDFGITAETMLTCSTESRKTGEFTGLDTPSATGISFPVCGRSCPVFKLYHTDEVGGWEIFRLDGADKATRTNQRINLSLGLDPNVENMAPSLSPDNEWMVFSSNRDGNWEIYVAPTSGGNPDSVERVTYNTVAIDSDPVWGPGNYVVYETTRHGNWDLYAMDMTTGVETRLTDSSGNDVNAYWSDDGSTIVFQSDRAAEDGTRKWQVYEMNLATLNTVKLSDGSMIDVDPQYSHSGSKIAFRSYSAASTNSVLSLMNADGSGRMAFSDAAGDATNAAWSPNDTYIAYQSDLDGDLDIYVYEVATGETRHLTDNAIADYAPTWLCDDVHVVWTSDIMGDPNIFEVDVTPISADPILVDQDADQMTFETSNDVYPLSSPSEENASREGKTVRGAFGTQTVFLDPLVSLTPIDLTTASISRAEWKPINVCPSNR